jgi:phage terminase large subunit-like protein
VASRRPPSLEEALGAFGQRLQQAATKPSINHYKPMPEQEIFHKLQTRHRLILGGNRGGKTFSSTADDVLVQLRRHPYRQHLYPERPLVGRFIGVDFERGVMQGAIPLFQQLVPPSKLRGGAWDTAFRPSEMMLYFEDGGRVSFMSYEQDPNKFQIVALDWVHFDEEPPKPIFDESRLRLLDSGGTMTISMTPVQQMEWIEDEIIDKVADGHLSEWSVTRLDTRKNIHLHEGAREELTQVLSEDEQKLRFEGQYLGKSLVFPQFRQVYPYIIPSQPLSRWRPDLGWQIWESMDYGLSNPTSWNWTATHYDGSVVVFKVIAAADVVVSQWAQIVHEMRQQIRDALGDASWQPAGTFGDPAIGQKNQAAGASAMSVQQLYAMHGIGIATNGIVKARSANQNFGLDRFRTYLMARPHAAGPAASTGELGAPWLQLTEDASKLAAEMRKARRPKQTLKQQEVANPKEEIRDKDNHSIDAEKYLFMSIPDLRPQRFQDLDEGGIPAEAYAAMRPAGSYIATHDDAFHATISSDRRSTDASSYSSLEG